MSCTGQKPLHSTKSGSMSKKIILYTLQTFSTTGGIQKMTRTMAYSLSQISQEQNWNFKLFSLYDSRYDLMDKYLPAGNYTGFGKKRIKFGLKTSSAKSDIVILSHINFSLIGIIIK